MLVDLVSGCLERVRQLGRCRSVRRCVGRGFASDERFEEALEAACRWPDRAWDFRGAKALSLDFVLCKCAAL